MRPKVLFVQPNYYRYFIQYLPNYEPLVCLLLAACVKDIAECRVFDRRFGSERSLGFMGSDTGNKRRTLGRTCESWTDS